MKLTRLELSGFKSFADTVTLDFEQGVTAIVGPNGCGKSNVSDAVRWVLGEQSARLLRGGKMEDVIFQGSTGRRPVNVTEVSLYLDNGAGELPVPYQEVVVTRRLSRSGQSDYLLNGTTVRLRDIQDLLRGTGLGSDAGVVIEAKMIDLLLSDRAEERRSLFEEAAGIGLYRNRKESAERRLGETAQDLQRVEDLIAEVQSQLRSLARQKGKTERHGLLMQERFSVEVTLAQRHLDRLHAEAGEAEARLHAVREELPAARSGLAHAETVREEAAARRLHAEQERTAVVQQLGQVRVELRQLEGDLALAAERLQNAARQHDRAEDERAQLQARLTEAATELEAASAERTAAEAEHQQIHAELARRAAEEEQVRQRLGEERQAVRQLELELQGHEKTARSLEGERAALTGDLAQLGEQRTQATAHRARVEASLAEAERLRDQRVERAGFLAYEARRAAEALVAARHGVAEAREHEARERAARRGAEERVAQLGARKQALEQLERDRVGLAPAAQALMAARARFGDGVLGPLSDFLTVGSEAAERAERLLGEWMHAVLVRDGAAIGEIRAWHAEQEPGALMLLPLDAVPAVEGAYPLAEELRAEGPAARWVRAALGGTEMLDALGRVVRRASGAVYLAASASASGPLRRRAELADIGHALVEAEGVLEAATQAVVTASAALAAAEAEAAAAAAAADKAREEERQAVALREDALRAVSNVHRDLAAAQGELHRLGERLARAETRLAEVDAALAEGALARSRLDEGLGTARASLEEREAAQEAAREQRVQWQVREAHVLARLQAARERAERAGSVQADATRRIALLGEELARLEADRDALEARRAEWEAAAAAARTRVEALETRATDAEGALASADAHLGGAEQALGSARVQVASLSDESHALELRMTEVTATRRSIGERIEQAWRQPLAELLAGFEPLDLDLDTLEAEHARITGALESIGPVNPLAVEEHAEESKRLQFLTSQRDDLVGARQTLLQAIKEIDGTARQLFLETFEAVRGHFLTVFQTLFGGGECELRLANADEPLDCEIEIHAAPRGKRTQRIHLLSSGERTLVATSLLFAIYLTKPSPFCLMDEVDAPLDDANVGRFTRLLDEFKGSTQFLVITHNPRTMQSADAVYGVTMQEPGVSTIVGVRLGQAEVA